MANGPTRSGDAMSAQQQAMRALAGSLEIAQTVRPAARNAYRRGDDLG